MRPLGSESSRTSRGLRNAGSVPEGPCSSWAVSRVRRVSTPFCRRCRTSSSSWCAGDGPERRGLEEKAGQRVTFLGSVDAEAAHELLRSARALVVPSRWYEAQPRVILEAFAAGVPVLASRIGALPELVEDGVNGRLVAVDDAEAWHKTLTEIADDAESVRLGDRAFATWSRRYAPELALRELEGAYELAARRDVRLAAR